MRGRDVFLDSLALHGVSKIFGNPGTTETPLLDSLRDRPELEYIVALHEGVAVGAANYYAQATGTTAVVNMHVAPGLGNGLGMLYGALKANTPMIATAGQQDTRIRLRDPLLSHDLVAMAAPVTKWSVQVERADEMAAIMQRAFKVANEHPKGPVFVALPIDVMEQETASPATVAGEIAVPSRVEETVLARLAELIKRAERPCIVAGDGVPRGRATDALVRFCERIGASVHLELLAMHVAFPPDHPHFRGRLGPDHAAIQSTLGTCDLVILVGGPFFEEVWYSAEVPFAEDAVLVQLDADPGRLAHNFSLTLGVAGDIGQTLTELTDLVGSHSAYQHRAEALAAENANSRQDASERMEALWERQPMTPARALHEVGQALPDNVVISDESITAASDVLASFPLNDGRDYFGGRGGGIGQGLAGAIGVAAAYPERPVVAVSGDGSAMYSIPALWSAAHHEQNILFVILSNREYRVLKHNADAYRQRFDAASNNPYPFMDLTNPVLGFVDVARGLGVEALQLTTADDIGAAVRRALDQPGPFLIDLVVEGKETR